MLHIKGHNVSSLTAKAASDIRNKGVLNDLNFTYRASPVVLKLTNPQARHQTSKFVDSNIFSSIGKTFWLMAGADNQYNPYWTTLVQGAQSPIDFRPVLEVFKPELFKETSVVEVPAYKFEIIDGVFTTTVKLGIEKLGVDLFSFAFLHELLFREVKKVIPSVTLGPLVTDVFSITSTAQEEPYDPNFGPHNENRVDLTGPLGGISTWPHFFGSLIAQFGSMLTQTPQVLKEEMPIHWQDIERLFDQYGVGYGDLMYEYVCLLYSYILSIKGVDAKHYVTRRLEGDLLTAVTFSKYRKFQLME